MVYTDVHSKDNPTVSHGARLHRLSHCIRIAVALHVLDEHIHFPFTYPIPFSQYGNNIRHLFSLLRQEAVFVVKADVLHIIRFYTGSDAYLKEAAARFQ